MIEETSFDYKDKICLQLNFNLKRVYNTMLFHEYPDTGVHTHTNSYTHILSR